MAWNKQWMEKDGHGRGPLHSHYWMTQAEIESEKRFTRYSVIVIVVCILVTVTLSMFSP